MPHWKRLYKKGPVQIIDGHLSWAAMPMGLYDKLSTPVVTTTSDKASAFDNASTFSQV